MSYDARMNLPSTDDYKNIFLNNTPMLDVRAPVEYNAGAFPHTTNQPLIDDIERHQIGIEYKEKGQDAAIDLGNELVKDEIKNLRVTAWKQFAENNPEAILYCFRGGLRSKTSQRWLAEETGIVMPRVDGGYKAMRRFLIEHLDDAFHQIKPIVIGGRTGSGKTLFLRQLKNSIDLEGHAWHRGSAFGHHATPQPTQIDFENRLSIDLLQKINHGYNELIFEDEGSYIGSVNLTQSTKDALAEAPIWLLDTSVEERIDITHDEYIHQALAEFEALDAKHGFDHWANYLINSMNKIQRRLGGQRHKELLDLLNHALIQHKEHGDTKAHKEWIARLLTEYYDPMYDYQISKKERHVIGIKSFDDLLKELTQ